MHPLLILMATFALSSTPLLSSDWSRIEPLAQSVERAEHHLLTFSQEVRRQLAERAGGGAGGREQILHDTVVGLERVVVCLKQRFFEGADHLEMQDRLQLTEALLARVRGAMARVSLFASTREHLTRFENELAWLRRQLAAAAPAPAPDVAAAPPPL